MKNVSNLKQIIRQAIDLHVHIGPEVIPRKYFAESLIKTELGKLAGAVLKNHFYPTTPFINTVNKGFRLYGSVVLNNFVGGLNPEAVYAASLVGPKPLFVWFPTISAREFLKNSKYEIAPEWINQSYFTARLAKDINGVSITDSNGKLSGNTIRVLKMIKSANAALCTGHISWQESALLIKTAIKLGIKKIIITHPIYQRIAMPVSIQKELAQMGAFTEQCYSMWAIDRISIKKIVQQIKAVGVSSCIITSDSGQAYSPAPSLALFLFCKKLLENSITLEEIETMLVSNPRLLVGLN